MRMTFFFNKKMYYMQGKNEIDILILL